MSLLGLLGSRWVQYAILAALAIGGAYRFTMVQQEKGAYREQVKQQAAQAAQDKTSLEAAQVRLQVEKSAHAKAAAESRRFQEALRNDKATADWVADCGKRQLSDSLWDYISGVPATTGGSPHAVTQ